MSQPHSWPPRGQLGYLQLPARDIARSANFYETVFGWTIDREHRSFAAPGLIGDWLTDRAPSATAGPLLWLCADDLYPTLDRVVESGGTVLDSPHLDHGERWLVEAADPAGNRIGIAVPARTASPQTLLAVRDVEVSSRWYQQLLGLRSGHGGPHYERLLADGVLVLQLHNWEVEHHHGQIGDESRPYGNGVLIWFGDVADFDGVVERAAGLDAEIVKPPHRNPPEGEGNGPGHREIWIRDPDGYVVVAASPDGEAYEQGGDIGPVG